jgi:hypothetical protein
MRGGNLRTDVSVFMLRRLLFVVARLVFSAGVGC